MKGIKFTYLIILAFSILFNACNRPSRPKEELKLAETLKPAHSFPYVDEQEKYPFPNSKEGYEQAGIELTNPLALTGQNLEEGKKLYLALCKHCHGETGNADAPMIIKGKYPIPPTFSKRLAAISEGKMFHSITYGKNQMPANGEDFSSEQKWLLVIYIQSLLNINADSLK